MKYAVLAVAVVAVLAASGSAMAVSQTICVNASAMLGVLLGLVSNGTPDGSDLVAAPVAILDAMQC